MQIENSSYERISRNEFQEMKAELRELKTSTQAHAGQDRRVLNNRGCYNCGTKIKLSFYCRKKAIVPVFMIRIVVRITQAMAREIETVALIETLTIIKVLKGKIVTGKMRDKIGFRETASS